MNHIVDFEERVAVEPFRFEKPNDSISGVLLDIEPITKDGKTNLRYVLHNCEENRSYGFFGTMDLNKKIRKTDIGKSLQIRFEGMSAPEPGKHAMKIFKVLAQSR